MPDELQDLFDLAIRKEIESQQLYEIAKDKVDNLTIKSLLKALVVEETGHIEKIKELGGFRINAKYNEVKIVELKNSGLFENQEMPQFVDLSDILLYAIKREQASIELYSNMISVMKEQEAKSICEQLAHDELKHKTKLELMYDDLFYG